MAPGRICFQVKIVTDGGDIPKRETQEVRGAGRFFESYEKHWMQRKWIAGSKEKGETVSALLSKIISEEPFRWILSLQDLICQSQRRVCWIKLECKPIGTRIRVSQSEQQRRGYNLSHYATSVCKIWNLQLEEVVFTVFCISPSCTAGRLEKVLNWALF